MKEIEKLQKVTSERQLFTGALVQLHDCLACGKAKHRWMLLSREEGDFLLISSGPVSIEKAVVWNSGCAKTPKISFEAAISQGRLFLVDTGLIEEANHYQSIKKPVKAE